MVALNTGSNTSLLQEPLGYIKADAQQVLDNNSIARGCNIQ
jgi:hypothetical protein